MLKQNVVLQQRGLRRLGLDPALETLELGLLTSARFVLEKEQHTLSQQPRRLLSPASSPTAGTSCSAEMNPDFSRSEAEPSLMHLGLLSTGRPWAPFSISPGMQEQAGPGV